MLSTSTRTTLPSVTTSHNLDTTAVRGLNPLTVSHLGLGFSGRVWRSCHSHQRVSSKLPHGRSVTTTELRLGSDVKRMQH